MNTGKQCNPKRNLVTVLIVFIYQGMLLLDDNENCC